MQIMCLNGWGGTQAEALLPYLADMSPDVLCLQEVVSTPDAPKEWLTYRDGDHVLPQRADFLGEVARALPDHVAIFCPAAEGVLWDEDRAVPSQWGLASFVTRRLPLVGQVQGFVHKDFSADGYGAHPRSRSAHGLRIWDRDGKRFVAIAHMHGLRDLGGKMDTPERRRQAERFLALSEQLSRPDDLRILCGDFNVEPESETLTLLAQAGFTELVTSRGFSGTRSSQYQKPGRFADYMAIDAVSAVRGFEVVRAPEVSDHCPLVLEI